MFVNWVVLALYYIIYMYCPTENNSLKNENIVKETDIQCT